MRRVFPWIVRATAIYLAGCIAFAVGVIAGVDDPRPSLLSAMLPGAVLGLALQAGLLWAPSAIGRQRVYAALLMVPSAALLALSASEEVHLMTIGRMHEASVALTYVGGVLVYAAQFIALARDGARPHASREAAESSLPPTGE